MITDVNGEAYPVNRFYVIQTFTGREQELIDYMHILVSPEILADAFIPRREMNRRLGGQWRVIIECIFPGYVFVRTKAPDSLFLSLREIPAMSNLLHYGEFSFIAFTSEEQKFIEKIGIERGDHTFGISKVAFCDEIPYRKGDKVQIIDGDLKDFEGEIASLNLHKRKAILRTKMFGGKDVYIHVGLEILSQGTINRSG
jgi:transcriptional antiterminator NusG